MADLQDGESAQVQGSAVRPYVLKNVGGVYSCSCPAWRNQSLGIERRTCKHLRLMRGEAAEQARLGALPPLTIQEGRAKPAAPPLLLAETWDSQTDPAGWFWSEKLDGVRAWWTGSQLLSRQGHVYHAPAWFTAGLPETPLDGELWLGRKQFQRTVSIVRRHDQSDLWKELRYLIFDAPACPGGFEDRLRFARERLAERQTPHARVLDHALCTGEAHLHEELDRVEALGGEGLMLRQPGSPYVAGRSATLLKVKRFRDAEAVVVGHQPGTGRHRGRLGALLVETAGGVRFAVGTGLSDAERDRPPALGSIIRFRYQELSDAGVPRFPVYAGVGEAGQLFPTIPTKGATIMAISSPTKRRFVFVGGSSDKFWELAVQGTAVVVRFGRNGTSGQSTRKEFSDAGKARQHADKMIRAKLAKGYVEAA